jgi:UDP-N-acetylglucosamine 2-epimerase (non-hydrolysing)
MKVAVIAGARPDFMKIAPIVHAISVCAAAGGPVRFRLIHSGQHYDARMSGEFFEQLGIPQPDVNLEVGSGTQAEQTAAIMIRYEALLMQNPSALCLVAGDVTSTMARAIAAQKLCIPVAHVEGGNRSGDWTMPEEVNRLVTDAITKLFFTTSAVANEKLRHFGVPEARIHFVGNTMIDTLLANMERLRAPGFWQLHGLEPRQYVLVTLQRAANVDSATTLAPFLEAIIEGARGLPMVFSVHPSTANVLAELPHLSGRFLCVEPQPYFEVNYLARHAKVVITDSGGVPEETTLMGVPCMTLRSTTERPETVTFRTNELLGVDPAALALAFARLFDGNWKRGVISETWDGRSGERIAMVLESSARAQQTVDL